MNSDKKTIKHFPTPSGLKTSSKKQRDIPRRHAGKAEHTSDKALIGEADRTLKPKDAPQFQPCAELHCNL